jgi:opacity protein-like surface antigen
MFAAAVAASAMIACPALAADVPTPVAIPAPPPGKGQIVFFRSGTIMGAAMGCSVNENGQKISSLGAGKYFIMVANPGRHEFSVKSEATDVLALEVEADETQFATCKIKMGIMAGRPDIRPATEADFRAQKNPKMVDVEDMGPAPGALRPDEVNAALAGAPRPAEPSTAGAPAQ